jgi:hypothetical protein
MDVWVFFLVVFSSVVVAFVTWLARRLKGTLKQRADDRTAHSDAVQFSIRHLMMLIFVVACLISAGKLLMRLMPEADLLTRLAALALCFAVVALVAIWATLGSGRPMLRSFYAILFAAIGGSIGGYVMARDEVTFWLGTAGIQVVLLTASLYVLRSIVGVGPRRRDSRP